MILKSGAVILFEDADNERVELREMGGRRRDTRRYVVTSLQKLFSPVRIGSMEVKNRLVMAPMTTQWAGPGDTITQRLIDYHVARARGGVGLITFEVCTVDRQYPYQLHTVGCGVTNLSPITGN